MINPPRPPDPKATQIVRAVQRSLKGQQVAIGIVIGVILSLLERLVGG